MDSTIDMQNRIVFITGATNGIGKITAEALARMGAHVVISGRDPRRTEAVALDLRAASGNPQVDYLCADLSSQAEVRKLADEYKSRYDRLDVLVNNAGAVFMSRQVSTDGLEMTFALNHLGYFLLAMLLLDTISASHPARIINVSSGAHTSGRINFEDLQGEHGFNGWSAYSQSKLANVLFSYELARRLEGKNVAVNALHPGFVATNFGKSNGGVFRPLFGLAHFAALSPAEGAETSIYLASSSEVDGVTGKYFERKKAVKSSTASYDANTARRLWDASLQLTHLPEMMRV